MRSEKGTQSGIPNREMAVRTVDTREYVSILRELVQEGKEVSMTIAGSSMSPFLCHARDRICFKAPWREPRRGDMVFYERPNGQFVMHRILRQTPQGYDIIGDAQIAVEHGVQREQIFAIITKVCRKGKWMQPGDFWWEFFGHVWLRVIPLRRMLTGLYGKLLGRRAETEEGTID